MQKIGLHIIRAYLKFGLNCYYRRFTVHNTHLIPKDKAVLFLANHQNALIDPLLIATKSGRFSYFLTRASVFKKPRISKFLHSLQMLPVYRVRDGWSNISNNNSIFSKCTELLNDKKAIVIFPEGSHHINKTVRPLSKGFTRIVFETLDKFPNTNLQLIPVGINFIKSEDFRDSTALYFAKPIAAQDYALEDRNKAIVSLKEDVHAAISNLTTHIPAKNYLENLEKLKATNPNFLKPEAVNACIKSNFTNCEKASKSKLEIFKTPIKYILLLNFIVPFLVWRNLVKPKIKEIEFMATFRFACYITLFPVWFFIVVSILGLLIGWKLAVVYAIILALLALFYVKA